MSKRRKYGPTETWQRIQHYCAYQERAHQEVRDKLYDWGCHFDEVEGLITRLLEDNYLNEERFARAFVSGKFRIKQWGKQRIKRELKMKRVSEACIRLGMQEIEDDAYQQTLITILTRHIQKYKSLKAFERNGKAARYAISRGFEADLVWSVLRSLEG